MPKWNTMITLLVDAFLLKDNSIKHTWSTAWVSQFCTSYYSAPGSSPLRTRTFWLPGVTSHQAHSLSLSAGSFQALCMGTEGEISCLLHLRWSPNQLLIFLCRKQTGSRVLRKRPGKTEAPKQENWEQEKLQEITGLAARNRNRLGVMGANFSSSAYLHQGDWGQEISLLHCCYQESACSAHE